MTEEAASALNLFFKPPIQTSIVKVDYVEVRPTSSLDDDSIIEFVISGSGTDYLDLGNVFIKVKVCVINPNNDNGYVNPNLVAPINNLLHSLFNKIDVMLNGKTVCSSDYHYAHRAYVETLLNFGRDTKKGELMAAF